MERFVKICDALIAGKSPLIVLQQKMLDPGEESYKIVPAFEMSHNLGGKVSRDT
jgi:hypothetical protein